MPVIAKIMVIGCLLCSCIAPAIAGDPTFTCTDGLRLAKQLYDRTREAHRKGFDAYARFLAESFWRVAEIFAQCPDVSKLGSGLINAGYPSSTRGEYPSGGGSIGTAVLAGRSGDVSWAALAVQLDPTSGAAVIDGKPVPQSLLVDGITYVPSAAPFYSPFRKKLEPEDWTKLFKEESSPYPATDQMLRDITKPPGLGERPVASKGK